MILSDVSTLEAIANKEIVLDPFIEENLQGSSIDVCVDRYFRVFRNHTTGFIDPKQPQEDMTELVEIDSKEVGDKAFMLHPGEFVLGSTLETIEIANHLVARLEGKSSLARLGLVIHSTAGYIDPGFKGTITLEFSNVATLPIAIYPGMKIGQLSFHKMTTPAERYYGSEKAKSKYLGQKGPTPSQYYKNF
jgi:dCTP deaminase